MDTAVKMDQMLARASCLSQLVLSYMQKGIWVESRKAADKLNDIMIETLKTWKAMGDRAATLELRQSLQIMVAEAEERDRVIDDLWKILRDQSAKLWDYRKKQDECPRSITSANRTIEDLRGQLEDLRTQLEVAKEWGCVGHSEKLLSAYTDSKGQTEEIEYLKTKIEDLNEEVRVLYYGDIVQFTRHENEIADNKALIENQIEDIANLRAELYAANEKLTQLKAALIIEKEHNKKIAHHKITIDVISMGSKMTKKYLTEDL